MADQTTYRPTDTAYHRDARTHLKTSLFEYFPKARYDFFEIDPLCIGGAQVSVGGNQLVVHETRIFGLI